MKESRNRQGGPQKPNASQHLLTVRAKQIKSLEEDIAGYAETVRLCAAFIGQLSVALIGAGEDASGVTGTRDENGAFSLRVSKEALSNAIDKWQIKIEKEEKAYRVMIEQKGRK